ncbi:MAG TPA: DPP IV N-terminal domain-containing protein [Pseudonocardiaceae bacterium]|nr:DPP IV N-terminal domain-containing protein [Pseudonocardiaceae bacterium]
MTGPPMVSARRDGDTSTGSVVFLRGRSGEDPLTCLWALDLDSGTERVLADPARLLDTEPAAGIGAYSTDAAGRRVAFVLADGLWTVDVHDADARRLPTPDQPVDPRLDPAGTRIAYRHGDELRRIDVAGTDDRALATPDGPDVMFGYGSLTGETAPDYTAPRGFWWAPGSKRLLVARSDVTQVQLWHLSDPTRPTRPGPARPGPHVPTAVLPWHVTLWIVDLDGTRTEVAWDRTAFEYVVGAGWDAHGPYTVVQSRDQRVLRLLGIDPATGRTSTLHEQRDDRWVRLLPGLPTRTGSGAVVATVDDGDTRAASMNWCCCPGSATPCRARQP